MRTTRGGDLETGSAGGDDSTDDCRVALAEPVRIHELELDSVLRESDAGGAAGCSTRHDRDAQLLACRWYEEERRSIVMRHPTTSSGNRIARSERVAGCSRRERAEL